MPARQDSRDGHVKYHLLQLKWQSCSGVLGYVFVCVSLWVVKRVYVAVCLYFCISMPCTGIN